MLVAGLVDFSMVVVGPTILQVVKGLVDPLLMVIEVDTFGGRGTDYDIEVVLWNPKTNHAYLPQNSDGTLAKLFGIIVHIQNKQPPNLYFGQ